MGQVPKILLVGDGRLAKALTVLVDGFALAGSGTPGTFLQWSRQSPFELSEILTRHPDVTHIWLAISDRSIVGFAREYKPLLEGRTLVHFSGSLGTVADPIPIHAAHPLMTFSGQPLDTATRERFAKTPFVLSPTGPELSELMPGFKNPSLRMKDSDRAYYHALCAIAGNFTVLLWESVAQRFAEDLKLDPKALMQYREQIFSNLASEAKGQSVLTGPMVRGDHATMQLHHDELMRRAEPQLTKIYEAFYDLYRVDQARKETK